MSTSMYSAGMKKVSFGADALEAKHPSDMNAFERIAYIQSLDLEKEQQKRDDDTDEDIEDGKLTKEVIKRYLSIKLRSLKYQMKIDPSRKNFDEDQTSILKEEVTARKPDLIRVVQCLERGANPNVIVDKSQSKPLHAVIRSGDPRLVDFLLQSGADVNSVDARNQTPLAKACDSQRVDRSYIEMVEVLLAHPDIGKGLEYRDSGSNTALLNAIFRSNVWLTRLLLLKKAKVKTGKRNAYDVATFIMASHIGLEADQIPDFIMNPHNQSCLSMAFSLRGRYHKWKDVFWQSFFNSDIELVYRMVKYRYEELEREQIQGKAHAETPEIEKPIVDVSIGGSAEARRVKRLEREMRKKRCRRERREKEEQERWELKKASMVNKVDNEFSINIYRNSKQLWLANNVEPSDGVLKWMPDTEEENSPAQLFPQSSNNQNTYLTPKPQFGRSSSVATAIDVNTTDGINSDYQKRKSSEAVKHSFSNPDLLTTGKRWKVESVEVDPKLYSDNPAPGTGLVVVREGRPPRVPLPIRESMSAGKN